MRSALVVGAGGAVGEVAALELAKAGWRVTASMHRPRPQVAERLRQAGCAIAQQDVMSHDVLADAAYDAVIFTTHLELTARALERADTRGANLVIFSSNNIAVHPEAPAYRALAAAEQKLRAAFPDAAVIRPTMIYGDPRLVTVTRLLSWARKFPILPLPGSGRARVQPVFYEDLGRIAAGLAARRAPGVYALGGPDIVTMRRLYEAVARAAGGQCRVTTIPPPLLAAAAPALVMLGYSRDQAARAERDRLAVAQTPLPPELAPRVDLQSGLAHLAATLGVLSQRPDHRLAS